MTYEIRQLNFPTSIRQKLEELIRMAERLQSSCFYELPAMDELRAAHYPPLLDEKAQGVFLLVSPLPSMGGARITRPSALKRGEKRYYILPDTSLDEAFSAIKDWWQQAKR